MACAFALAFAIGITIATGAHSQSPWPQMAPASYAHAYHGHLTVQYGSPAQIHARCGNFARACTAPHRHSCTIYVPSPTPGAAPEIYAALRAHEIAHCNGWRH
jgi:hypothetical protein